jgi:hypothetical protein
MAVLNNIWSLAFVYLVFVVSLECSEDICVKRTPCKCVFSNGTGIDLTPVAKAEFFAAQNFKQTKDGSEYELNKYYFHPCTDTKVNRTNLPGDSCGDPMSVSIHNCG